MSVGLSVSIVDNATPALEAKLAKCNPQRLRPMLAPGLTTFVQRHLVANGTNKRGWPSTNFWADAARATSWTAVDGGGKDVSISININKIGVRQRWKGGVIAPVRASALAIPISPVSYGHVPKDFPNLFLLKTKKGAYLCDRGQAISTKSSKVVGIKVGGNKSRQLKADLIFLFKLVGSVTQKPDPGCIPTGDQLAEVGMGILERAIK